MFVTKSTNVGGYQVMDSRPCTAAPCLIGLFFTARHCGSAEPACSTLLAAASASFFVSGNTVECCCLESLTKDNEPCSISCTVGYHWVLDQQMHHGPGHLCEKIFCCTF